VLISLSFISTVSAINLENDVFKDGFEKPTSTKKIVTLSRYGLDGSETLIKVEVEVNQWEDVNDKIEDKCTELLASDPELQKLLDNNISKDALSFIRSKGRGLHIKLNPYLNIPTRNKITQFLSTEKNRKIRIPIIYGRYPNDGKAFTTTISLSNSTNTTNGPHSVICIGFYGYKWWLGRISWCGFLLRTGFVGFSIYTKVNDL
jgi:hypothetical protein